MNTFLLTISSPDGNAFEGEAVSFSVRGTEGELAVMAGHIPFVTAVKPCDCAVVLPDGSRKTGHTDGGLLSVSGKAATLLTGTFEWRTT